MSHIFTITAKIHDATVVAAACRRLHLPDPVQGTAQLYSGEATGLLVQLPGWEYPAVIDPLTGTIRYDNFNGEWGDQARLDAFLQAYAVEKAHLEARREGHTVMEETLADGSIHLQIWEAA